MKQLQVPLILQNTKSIDCGPICVQMVLKYHGIQIDLEKMKSKLNYDKVGTSMYDNGALLLDEGLRTNIITAQPMLFPPDIIAKLKSQEDILKFLEEKNKVIKKNNNLNTFIKYLKKGGTIQLEIPVFEHIKKAIDEDKPIIALMNAQSLGSNEGAFHFVVVTGYRENEVHINNPWPHSQQQGWFSIQQFLYGVYASTCAFYDNGTFLIASKS